jgi:hypothetical protein
VPEIPENISDMEDKAVQEDIIIGLVAEQIASTWRIQTAAIILHSTNIQDMEVTSVHENIISVHSKTEVDNLFHSSYCSIIFNYVTIFTNSMAVKP